MDIISFATYAIRGGMPLLLGSTGETITEKSGHLNLGIPGIMCVGAACGCMAEEIYLTHLNGAAVVPAVAVIIPIIAAIFGGAIMGLLYSFFAVTLRANQNVTGLVLTTLGSGISGYIISLAKEARFSTASKYFTNLFTLPENPNWAQKLFLSYGILIYLAIAIAVISQIVLSKTRAGLHLRAVGENPATADAAGISVTGYRYISTVIGSSIAGLGGFCYIMDNLSGCWEYTIEAIGWLSIALVIFTVWKPGIGIFGSILFGVLLKIPNYVDGITDITKPVFKMLPYVVTIIVLIIISIRDKKENQPPQSLGLSYFREDR